MILMFKKHQNKTLGHKVRVCVLKYLSIGL